MLLGPVTSESAMGQRHHPASFWGDRVTGGRDRRGGAIAAAKAMCVPGRHHPASPHIAASGGIRGMSTVQMRKPRPGDRAKMSGFLRDQRMPTGTL